MIFTTPERARC